MRGHLIVANCANVVFNISRWRRKVSFPGKLGNKTLLNVILYGVDDYGYKPLRLNLIGARNSGFRSIVEAEQYIQDRLVFHELIREIVHYAVRLDMDPYDYYISDNLLTVTYASFTH